MADSQRYEPDADVLSDVDDTVSEAETLPDAASRSVESIQVQHTQASRSEAESLHSSDNERRNQTATQAMKAIEAAGNVDRISSPLQSPRFGYAPSSSRPTAADEATEQTPLLDAGPAQPPPDYAAATAWQRMAQPYSNRVTVSEGAPPNVQVHSGANQPLAPLPLPQETSTSETNSDLEMGGDKERKRKRSPLHRFSEIVFAILYILFVIFYHLGKFLGTATAAVVRRCRESRIIVKVITTIAIITSLAVVGTIAVFVILKKLHKI